MNRQLAAVTLVASAILGAAPAQWNSVGPPGGIISHLVADSQNPATIYASTFGGALFKSSDGAASWTALDFPSDGCSVLAADPQTSGTLYAVAGDGFYRSTDAGANWELVSLRAIGITVQTLIATTSKAIYASGGPATGIFKSVDGGASWSLIIAGFSLLAIDSQNPDILYANGLDGVFKSSDAGVNWKIINASVHAASAFAIDPQDSNIVYIGSGWSLLKSVDGGANWISLDFGFAPTFPPVIPDGIVSLAVHPGNSAQLYALIHRFVDVPGLLTSTYSLIMSTDAGTTWTKVVDPALNSTDLTTLLPDSIDPSSLYLGTANGVLKTTDSGASWTAVNSGLRAAPLRQLQINPQDPNAVLALPDTMSRFTAAGLFKSADGGNNWLQSGSGFPSGALNLVADPQAPGTLYAMGAHNRTAGNSSGIGIVKSTDGGDRWTEIWSTTNSGAFAGLRCAGRAIQRWRTHLDSALLTALDGGIRDSAVGRSAQRQRYLRRYSRPRRLGHRRTL